MLRWLRHLLRLDGPPPGRQPFTRFYNPFPHVPQWDNCAGCPDPDVCNTTGCTGMDGVTLTDDEMKEIG